MGEKNETHQFFDRNTGSMNTVFYWFFDPPKIIYWLIWDKQNSLTWISKIRFCYAISHDQKESALTYTINFEIVELFVEWHAYKASKSKHYIPANEKLDVSVELKKKIVIFPRF